MTTHRWFLIPAIAGIAIASVFLVRAASDASVYYLYASEAVAQRADFPDDTRFRIAGTVVPGTVVDDGSTSTFDISDGLATVTIRLVSLPPPLFQEDIEVLLEGAWKGEIFEADEALIRHEADYRAPPPPTGDMPETETG